MRSACRALPDTHLGECEHRSTCLRYQHYLDHPLEWAAHRQCRTKGYDFYLSCEDPAPTESHRTE